VDTFQALYPRGDATSETSLRVHRLHESAATEKGGTSGGGKHRRGVETMLFQEDFVMVLKRRPNLTKNGSSYLPHLASGGMRQQEMMEAAVILSFSCMLIQSLSEPLFLST
jgi:hypothetical protein